MKKNIDPLLSYRPTFYLFIYLANTALAGLLKEMDLL